MSNIALIPARSGSERVPNKNIRILKNKPLIAHTIEPAIESRLFLKESNFLIVKYIKSLLRKKAGIENSIKAGKYIAPKEHINNAADNIK